MGGLHQVEPERPSDLVARWPRATAPHSIGTEPPASVVGIEIAEHDVGVGDGRLGAAAARSRQGPGTAPALCGPTLSEPAWSSQTMLPPPAPTSEMSMTGSFSA